MPVTGYDTVHNLVPNIPWDAHVVMGYDTGSSLVRWSSLDFRRFPKARVVHIDQGGPGSPVLTATVRDVERGAWTPQTAVRDTKGWSAERPTIYCNQSTLPEVLASGWRGDLWLAILTPKPPAQPPRVEGCSVVAVQYRFGQLYDTSVVFDDSWPRKAKPMSDVQFAAPEGLRELVLVSLEWDAVQSVGDERPTGYTVAFYDEHGALVGDTMTTLPQLINYLLPGHGGYEVHVWANGGTIAPPHASMALSV